MKIHARQHTLQKLMEHQKFSQILLVILSLTSLILTVLVAFRQEKWVLIPQYETAHRVIVTSEGYSDTYVEDLIGTSLKHLFTVNPNTVDREIKLFSEFSGDTQALNVFLKRHSKYIKENDVLSVFYPKNFTHNEGYILVQGDIYYRFGQKKDLIQQSKTFKIPYEIGSKGLLLILSIEEVKS